MSKNILRVLGGISVLFLALGSRPARAEIQRYFSMNLHCLVGDWKARLDLVADELVRRDVDVAGFQEVCRKGSSDMAEYLVGALLARGYAVAYWSAVNTHKSFYRSQEQLLMISRLPVASHEAGRLPSIAMLANYYQGAQINGRWIVNTHLHFMLPQLRKIQVKRISKLWSSRDVLMLGDFNSAPNKKAMKPLRDAKWAALFAGPTYPADDPKKIFDGFWLSESLSKRVQRARATTVFGGYSPSVSDHLGVVLDVDFASLE